MRRSTEGKNPSFKFWIKVRPRARRTSVRRSENGEIRFETTSPPVAGKANEALVEYLSQALRLPRSALQIRTGATSRRKLIEISGEQAKNAAERLNSLLETGEITN